MPRCVDDTVDELRGNPFIAEKVKITNPDDMFYGEEYKRLCGQCFYRGGLTNIRRDCSIAGYTAKKAFGVSPDDFMPHKIEGKPVGHYCRSWVAFTCE